jgi:hypothetical protein
MVAHEELCDALETLLYYCPGAARSAPGGVIAEGIVRASEAMQPLDLCGLMGKHFPPPDLGHEPRRPGAPINRLITQIDQSISELWLANTKPESEWNFSGPYGIASGVMHDTKW